jgi:hypothetical protein
MRPGPPSIRDPVSIDCPRRGHWEQAEGSSTVFPYVFPIRIIVPVLNIFSTSFVAVPALSLVLPLTTSGPGKGAIKKSTSPDSPSAEGSTHTTPIVIHPLRFANPIHPRTYGVRPDAAIPTTLSTSGLSLSAAISASASARLSSAPSWARRIAASPPAIRPMNCSGGAAKVGGISEASRIPSLQARPSHYYLLLLLPFGGREAI